MTSAFCAVAPPSPGWVISFRCRGNSGSVWLHDGTFQYSRNNVFVIMKMSFHPRVSFDNIIIIIIITRKRLPSGFYGRNRVTLVSFFRMREHALSPAGRGRQEQCDILSRYLLHTFHSNASFIVKGAQVPRPYWRKTVLRSLYIQSLKISVLHQPKPNILYVFPRPPEYVDPAWTKMLFTGWWRKGWEEYCGILSKVREKRLTLNGKWQDMRNGRNIYRRCR